MQTITFLILATLILFITHYFLYFSVTRFFSIDNRSQKILSAIFILLPLSFILSLLLARMKEYFLIRAMYFISGFWMGLVTYLLISCLVVWLIILITKFSNINTSPAILTTVLFLFSFIISLYGVWNVFNPKIKNVSVDITGISEQWKGKKKRMLI